MRVSSTYRQAVAVGLPNSAASWGSVTVLYRCTSAGRAWRKLAAYSAVEGTGRSSLPRRAVRQHYYQKRR